MQVMRFVMAAISAAAFCNATLGATVLINPTTLNGSFEDPPTTKTPSWATVPAWEDWGASVGGPSTANNDSGTDVSGAATNGTHTAFLQPNNAAYDLTSHIVQVGEKFTYTWDWALTGRGNATAQLAYQDAIGNIVGIAGTTSTNPVNTSPQLGLGAMFTALAGDPAIGRRIALTVRSGPTNFNYPEVDNFVLQVVPEPGSLAMLCLALGGMWIAGRNRVKI